MTVSGLKPPHALLPRHCMHKCDSASFERDGIPPSYYVLVQMVTPGVARRGWRDASRLSWQGVKEEGGGTDLGGGERGALACCKCAAHRVWK